MRHYKVPIGDILWVAIGWGAFTLSDGLKGRFPRRSIQACGAATRRLARAKSIRADRWRVHLLVTEGRLWEQLGDQQRSLQTNDEVILSYESSNDSYIRQQVAWAKVNKSVDLAALGRVNEAIELERTLTLTLPSDPPFLHVRVRTLMNSAVDLSSLGRHEEEKSLYDRVQAVLSANADPSLDDTLAWASINKGIQLVDQHDYEAGVELFDVVIRRWWTSVSVDTPMSLHEALAAAGRNRCRALTFLKRYDEVIRDADRIVDRYLRTHNQRIDDEVAWAALLKAHAQEKLGRVADARATCDLLVTRYEKSQRTQSALAEANSRRLASFSNKA